MSDQLGRTEGTLRERSVTPDVSRKIQPPAMRVIKAGTKGGPHDDVSVCRCIGDFGISVFHRPGRSSRLKASPLNRGSDVSGVRGDGVQFNQRRKGLGYDGEKQEKCDFGA